MKFAKMVAQRAQITLAGEKNSPMRAPALLEDQLSEFCARLEANQVRGDSRHIGIELTGVKAAMLRAVLVEVLNQLGSRSAIKGRENG